MITGTRYAPAKQQELRSRHQLSDRFVKFGWLPTVPEDLGEDFIVHIYYDGRPTGVNFYVQEKSVTNLQERRKGDYIPYPFKVKDLTHWEQFEYPVVLIIWDVNLQEGRWALLHTIIKELDQRDPHWRRQKTKTVYIPWQNATDHAGLVRLRKSIGQHLYPLIAKGKPNEVQLQVVFDTSTEIGKENWQVFNLWQQTGQEVILKGVTAEFTYPEWYAFWFGKPDYSEWDFKLGARSSSLVEPVHISIADDEGSTAPVQIIELKAVEVGEERTRLTNEHQTGTPLYFELIVSKLNRESSLSIKINNIKLNVLTVRDVLKFMQSVSIGGTLRVTFPTRHNASLTFSTVPIPEAAASPQYVELIEKLCFIQDKIGQSLQIVPTEAINYEDVQAIDELATIIKRGKTAKKNQVITGEFKREALKIFLELHCQGQPINLKMFSDTSHVELFGLKIQTGPLVRYINGRLRVRPAELERAIATLGPGQSLNLKLVDAHVVEMFPDWFMQEAERLSRLLVEKFEVESVYLFGSLAWSENFTPETDIDLAVRGLPSEQYFKAIGYLEQETDFAFDLVDLDSTSARLRQRVLLEGKRLYDQEEFVGTSE